MLATCCDTSSIEGQGKSRAMAESDSLRERALSAVAFMLLVFGLAAVLQTWGFFHINANSASNVVTRGKSTSQFGVPQDAITDTQGGSQTKPTERLNAPSHSEIQEMLKETQTANAKVQKGYGSITGALKALKRLTSYAKDEKCDKPRVLVLDRCICPAGSKWDGSTCTQSTDEMFFYMYRAQSDHNYVMSNVDMADLAGVMYYLHHEIVKINATHMRMNGITRILRFLVTIRPSEELARQRRTFMPFVAFDFGKCSVPGCNKLWDHYGFAVGCQQQGESTGFAYTSANDPYGVWFSLPGACPALPIGSKDLGAKQMWQNMQ